MITIPLIIPSPRTGKVPQIHESVFVAPTAVIIGNVVIQEHSSVWFGSVLRGDVGFIKIGKNVCVQEMVTMHNEEGTSVIIENICTIGHHAMIHGPCVIEEGSLVGVGTNVLHNSKIGKGSILGAGALVVNNEIPPFTFAIGIPAKIKRQLSENEPLAGKEASKRYVVNAKKFKEFFEKSSQH